MIFKVRSITVEIDYFSTIMVSLLLCIDRCSVMLPALLAAFFHELGHTLAMLLLGGRMKSICLRAWGILIDCVDYSLKPISRIIILAAGPLVNLILAVVLYKYNTDFCAVNIVCAVLNLLPCYNLDGGEILFTALEQCLSQTVTVRIMTVLTVVISVILMLFGVKIVVSSMNPSLLVVGAYILIMMLLAKLKTK